MFAFKEDRYGYKIQDSYYRYPLEQSAKITFSADGGTETAKLNINGERWFIKSISVTKSESVSDVEIAVDGYVLDSVSSKYPLDTIAEYGTLLTADSVIEVSGFVAPPPPPPEKPPEEEPQPEEPPNENGGSSVMRALADDSDYLEVIVKGFRLI